MMPLLVAFVTTAMVTKNKVVTVINILSSINPASDIYSTHFAICFSPHTPPSAPLTLITSSIINARRTGAAIKSTSSTRIKTPRLFFTAIAEASVTLDTDSTISPIPGIAPAVLCTTAPPF